MTQQIYTVQQLQDKTLPKLKAIYNRIGAMGRVADERRRSAWAEAIVTHQTAAQAQLAAKPQIQIPTKENPFTVEQAAELGYVFSMPGIGNFVTIRGYNEKGQVIVNDGYDDLYFSVENIEMRTFGEVVAAKDPLDEQEIAQAELNAHIDQQAEEIAPELQRLASNHQGYQDAIAGLASLSSDPCYRMGYERGARDVSPMPEESENEAIAFEKIGNTVYGGKWEATVNGILVRIAAVNGGYKTNLTGDTLLVDFGIAVKKALLAVAVIQASETKAQKTVTVAEIKAA